MHYRPLLGGNTASAIVRVLAVCFAAICAVAHVGSAIYWTGVSDHRLSALVSVLLAAASSLVVRCCLAARSAHLSGAMSVVLAVATTGLLVLYGV